MKGLELAMLVAEPRLGGVLPGHERLLLERVARVRVRRVVAALNGLDVERFAAPDLDEGTLPVLMSREMVSRLQAGILTAAGAAALEAGLGVETAAMLMGEIAAL